jgi:hypothetical protein
MTACATIGAMGDPRDLTGKPSPRPGPRRPYRRPQLRRLGTLVEMTQATDTVGMNDAAKGNVKT